MKILDGKMERSQTLKLLQDPVQDNDEYHHYKHLMHFD